MRRGQGRALCLRPDTIVQVRESNGFNQGVHRGDGKKQLDQRNVYETESKRCGDLDGCGDQKRAESVTPKFLVLGGGATCHAEE